MTTDIIYGIHSVEAVLNKNPHCIKRLITQKNTDKKRLLELTQLASTHDISIEYWSKEAMNKQFHDVSHQGIAAYCTQPASYTESDLDAFLNDLNHPPFLLILDNIQDPHNLGACLRTADAAGIDLVIIPKDRSAGMTAVVSKVASGAAQTIPLMIVTNLARTLRFIKQQGIWVYGAAEEAEKSLYQTDLTGSLALVLGAEGTGLRRLTREECDALVHIPMSGYVKSVNVSVATGICLFEAVRQRLR